MEHYCLRARSGFYRSNADKRPMGTFQVFEEIAKIAKHGSRYWLKRLKNVETNDFVHILGQIPNSEISKSATLFAVKMLEINKNHLLNMEIK